MSVQDRWREYRPDQREFFDELITEDWTTYQSSEWDAMRRYEVELLWHTVGRVATVLDVGCGCGFHDLVMADQPGVERVEGIDYSPRSIEAAERHYPHARVERHVADLAQMPAETPFDLVVSFQVIEHVEDAAGFLRDCARHARPGGWVAAFSVNRLRPWNRRRLRRGLEPQLDDPLHRREFAREALADLGRAVGLEPRASFAYLKAGRGPIAWRLRAGRWWPPWGERIGAVWHVPRLAP